MKKNKAVRGDNALGEPWSLGVPGLTGVSEHIPSPTKASTTGFLLSFSFVRFLLEYTLSYLVFGRLFLISSEQCILLILERKEVKKVETYCANTTRSQPIKNLTLLCVSQGCGFLIDT